MRFKQRIKMIEEQYPEVSKTTYNRCREIGKVLEDKWLKYLWIYPNDFGGIDFRFDKAKVQVVISIGDDSFSYYIAKVGESQPDFYSFLEYNEKNLTDLVLIMNKL